MRKPVDPQALPVALAEGIRTVKQQFGSSADLVVREMTCGGHQLAFVYLDGLVDQDRVYRLMHLLLVRNPSPREIRTVAGTVGAVTPIRQYPDLFAAILDGETAILINGAAGGLTVGTAGGEHRNVSRPTSQNVIRGPQEGFTESIRTNTALVRRKIKHPDLHLENQQIGAYTKTDVSMMFIHGLADDNVVQKVRQRLGAIKIDGVLEGNYVEECIQDNTLTIFPTVNNTERPDVVAAALLEGRVAIFVDGTPFVLLVPALFAQFLQSAEDYYHRTGASLLRLLRLFALLIALFAPAMYIALTTYHQEMIPTQLLISLAAQREGTPFPAFVEAMIMEVTFEMLREAAIRMPKGISTAISIVGALVLGQTAVEAGLVSPGIVIVVSMTAIANFIFPSFDIAISTRVMRFGFMALSATFGQFGIVVGLILLVLHLSHLKSFGVSYMSPLAPFQLRGQQDFLIRLPWEKRKHPAPVPDTDPPEHTPSPS